MAQIDEGLLYETESKFKHEVEDFKKGLYGFRNGAPAYASNNWAEVDLFLHTWGFLPGDNSILEKLTRQQLMELCGFALECACSIDLAGKGIKATQELMHRFGISPEELEKSLLGDEHASNTISEVED